MKYAYAYTKAKFSAKASTKICLPLSSEIKLAPDPQTKNQIMKKIKNKKKYKIILSREIK